MSFCPSDKRDAEPIVSGKTQLQQMSVMGFMKRPWQVGPAKTGAASAKLARRSASATRRLQDFIDARDAAQVKRASGILDERGGKLKVILTGGSYLDLMRRWKRPVFFDQQGTLTDKLGIRHVPALVTQDGKRLKIEEIPG